jgi:regulator of replication initiation timing
MIDRLSPAGSWEREWDARSHTASEYRDEIAGMRQRIQEYLAEIAALKAENAELRARECAWVREP